MKKEYLYIGGALLIIGGLYLWNKNKIAKASAPTQAPTITQPSSSQTPKVSEDLEQLKNLKDGATYNGINYDGYAVSGVYRKSDNKLVTSEGEALSIGWKSDMLNSVDILTNKENEGYVYESALAKKEWWRQRIY